MSVRGTGSADDGESRPKNTVTSSRLTSAGEYVQFYGVSCKSLVCFGVMAVSAGCLVCLAFYCIFYDVDVIVAR